MRDPDLYLAMAAGCIDELGTDERMAIPADVFAKLMRICAEVAARRYGVSTDRLPQPPDTIYVRAYTLVPGDFVWRPDASFSCIDAVHLDGEGEPVFVQWAGEKSTPYSWDDLVRIAGSRSEARLWNEARVRFDPAMAELLADAFGGRR